VDLKWIVIMRLYRIGTLDMYEIHHLLHGLRFGSEVDYKNDVYGLPVRLYLAMIPIDLVS
jgi:hypothetical protein